MGIDHLFSGVKLIQNHSNHPQTSLKITQITKTTIKPIKNPPRDSHQVRNLLAPRSDDALFLYDVRPPVIFRGVGTAQDLLYLGYLGLFPDNL